jgi:hypothetical protein
MKPSELPMKFVMTAAFADHYGPIEPLAYIDLLKRLWPENPYDMYILENHKEGEIKISIQGYHLDTEAFLDKTMWVTESLPIRKFWIKIDNYGDYLLATFLFPEDY